MTDRKLADYKPGMRVRIHPASDWFMRGETHAIVKTVGRKRLTLQGERSGIGWASLRLDYYDPV